MVQTFKNTLIGFLTLVAALAVIFVAPAQASQVDTLIEKLVEKKILTRLDAESIRSEIETAEKQDFKAQVKSANPWLEGLTSKGDVRLRYEAFNREDETSVHDRNRFRIRVRWGLEKKFNDEWKAGFQLASGEDRFAPTSNNQTLTDEFSFKNIFISQAYGIYTPQAPKEWAPVINHVEIGGGKFENPYTKYGWNTSIIWDGDVTPEGIYEKVDFRLATPSDEASWDLNTLMGQFIVDEDSDSRPSDIEVFAYGVGTTYQWKKNHNFSFKYTFYDWEDYAQLIKAGASTVPDSLGGNDRNLDAFKIHNFYAEINFDTPTLFWGVMPLKIYGDYAWNAGVSDENEAYGTTNEALRNPKFRNDSDAAFSIGGTLGKAKDPGSWQFGYEYLYIEPNAVVGNFSESDLGLGFANNKGHKLSWKYMLHKSIELNATAWMVERIDKSILTYGSSGLRPFGDDDQVLRTQLDLVYKF